MVVRSLVLAAVICLVACERPGAQEFAPATLTDVFAADFHSDKPAFCDALDTDLSHADAQAFFTRSRVVSSKELHDHYDIAPCHLEGVAKDGALLCDWKIRPGGTGLVSCGEKTWNVVCDDCEDLYKD